MKRHLISTIVLLSIICNVFAEESNISEILVNAENAYTTQDYEKAITLYDSVIAQGYESADIFFNSGNAFFKNGDLQKAILYYEKAKLLDPNDSDIAHNLAFAYSRQPDNIEQIPDGFITRIAQWFYRLLPVDGWAATSIIFILIFCIATCIFLFTDRIVRKKISITVLTISFFFAIISFCSAKTRYSELTSQEYAIIMEPTTTIKTEPSVNASELATIHGGLKVRIVKEAFGWLKITLANGKEGWILAEQVERI